MTYARMPGNALARLTAGVILVAGFAAPALLGAAPAGAVACGTAVAAGTSCSMTGTFGLSAGAMTMTTPGSLSWSGTLTGVDQQLVDGTAGDQGYTVDDASGSAPGWHVTLSATQFTTGGSTPSTLANSGTLSTTGSITSTSATSSPSAACATGSTCTLPTNTTTYPVAVTTAATSPAAVTIYDVSAGTGTGKISIGGSGAADPVGWWLNVPGNTPAGSYTSTITLEIISGP